MVDVANEEQIDEAQFKGDGKYHVWHAVGTMDALERMREILLILSPEQLAEDIINDNILREMSPIVIAM